MRIIIGSDHAGYRLKGVIIEFLQARAIGTIKDIGTFSGESCDYPDYAYKVAYAVSQRRFDRGILICASGIGMSIVANRIRGVRAALCYNRLSAQLSREHNKANVIIFGARFFSDNLVKEMLEVWLNTPFSQKRRHRLRIAKIDRPEEERRIQ